MRVTFNELAERELNDAAQYYEHEERGLGEAFIREVRRCTASIVEHPEAGAVVLAPIRRRLCQRFPYALLYTLKGEELRILAIMNLKRRPGYLGRPSIDDGPTCAGADALGRLAPAGGFPRSGVTLTRPSR